MAWRTFTTGWTVQRKSFGRNYQGALTTLWNWFEKMKTVRVVPFWNFSRTGETVPLVCERRNYREYFFPGYKELELWITIHRLLDWKFIVLITWLSMNGAEMTTQITIRHESNGFCQFLTVRRQRQVPPGTVLRCEMTFRWKWKELNSNQHEAVASKEITTVELQWFWRDRLPSVHRQAAAADIIKLATELRSRGVEFYPGTTACITEECQPAWAQNT